MPDAIVVGSGPNGLSAAIQLAHAGRSVVLLEAAETVGGGTRTAELTLPGFRHDVCSAIHPLGAGSPFFRSLPLSEHGLEWIHPIVPLAHPLDDGRVVLLERSVEGTARGLAEDAAAYAELIGPIVERWDSLEADLLGPLRVPRHPLALARFGTTALRSAAGLARSRFKTKQARALFAGLAAHSILPLRKPATASFGLVLAALGHVFGWPFPKGGSQAIADSLSGYFHALGGEVETGHEVRELEELAVADIGLLDVTPHQLRRLGGSRLSSRYQARLGRYRYGPGVFKLDLALDGPIPWTASDCLRAGTVHVGGTLDEIEYAEQAVASGQHPDRPFVLVAQQSLFDPWRSPDGKHTVWAYCHVPNGSSVDMAERIEAQIERFAPGFRERILARHTMGPGDYERYNANYVGGDINGGSQDLGQLFTRPVARLVPYSTPIRGLYLCSSSTPPGGGVHGMCGYHAARAALRASR